MFIAPAGHMIMRDAIVGAPTRTFRPLDRSTLPSTGGPTRHVARLIGAVEAGLFRFTPDPRRS